MSDYLFSVFNNFGMNTNFNNSQVKESCRPVVKYDNKITPAIRVGSKACDTKIESFSTPWGVTVDYKSEYIYVTEQRNNRVHVFDSEGMLLYQFGMGEMKSPIGIAISQERIFITQYDNSYLLVYNIDGVLICKTCLTVGENTLRAQLRGIAVNQYNGDIYVCNIFQNKIHILSDVYRFKNHFGSGIAKNPVDLQIIENHIVVLSTIDPHLYTFDFDFNPIHNLIPDISYTHLKSPNGFFIDGNCNFIFSNFKKRNVVVIGKNGTLLHELSQDIDSPVGVTVDSRGRILVVTHSSLKLCIF